MNTFSLALIGFLFTFKASACGPNSTTYKVGQTTVVISGYSIYLPPSVKPSLVNGSMDVTLNPSGGTPIKLNFSCDDHYCRSERPTSLEGDVPIAISFHGKKQTGKVFFGRVRRGGMGTDCGGNGELPECIFNPKLCGSSGVPDKSGGRN